MDIKITHRLNAEDTESDGILHPLLARIFRSRGLDPMRALERGLPHLLPFHSLKNIDRAVARLLQALERQESILIIGDYDADGATSTAVGVSVLRQLGFQHVDFLVPNRFEYGYGLTPEIVALAQAKHPRLIITVDNGIASIDGVARANAAGIDVVITDHHLSGEVLPEAVAIVNPNQPGDLFPSKALAGVGVIFYMMLALRAALKEKQWFERTGIPYPHLAEQLDLVALGTVADVVPLDHNNRILVYQGLERIKAGFARPGLQALLQVAAREAKTLTAMDLGFVLGPRLNAAGRLDDMSWGIHCLLARRVEEAWPLAVQLDHLNRERREIEQGMQEEAFKAVSRLQLKDELPHGVCLYDSSWHQGVVGLVASRVKDKIHRPVIAFAQSDEETLKGSARSVHGVHIRDVLANVAAQYPAVLTKFGGHASAAGLTLRKTDLARFSDAFAAEVAKQLVKEDMCAHYQTDGALGEIELDLNVAQLLESAGPWGQGCPEPLFDGEFYVIDQRLLKGKHLKLTLRSLQTADRLISAIAFNVNGNEWPNERVECVRLIYRLSINEYQGNRTLQLVIEHLEPVYDSVPGRGGKITRTSNP